MADHFDWTGLFISNDGIRWRLFDANPGTRGLVERLAPVCVRGTTYDELLMYAERLSVPTPFNVDGMSADWTVAWRVIQIGTAHAANIASALALCPDRSCDLSRADGSPVHEAARQVILASIDAARKFGPDNHA